MPQNRAGYVLGRVVGGMEDRVTDECLHTCTIITGERKEFVPEMDTRMPVILPNERHLSGELGKRDFGPVPGGPNESVADQFSCK
jgi:hypothetical protein